MQYCQYYYWKQFVHPVVFILKLFHPLPICHGVAQARVLNIKNASHEL